MDQKLDDRIKCEKDKIHVRYLIIIAGILAVIGISLAIGGNEDALGQISMASTVSSIILSAIAIFMSISGEYKLTYTHNKLLETSERMSNITADIEKANSSLEDTINEKLLKIDDIFESLEQIGQSVGNVEKEVLGKPIFISEESVADIPKDTLWNVYNSMLNSYNDTGKRITRILMEYIVVCCSKGYPVIYSNFANYFESEFDDASNLFIGLAWGIYAVFFVIGMTKLETVKYFEERMKISKENRNKIEKFLLL